MKWTKLTKLSKPVHPCVFAEIKRGKILYGFLAICEGDMRLGTPQGYTHYCQLPAVKP